MNSSDVQLWWKFLLDKIDNPQVVYEYNDLRRSKCEFFEKLKIYWTAAKTRSFVEVNRISLFECINVFIHDFYKKGCMASNHFQ